MGVEAARTELERLGALVRPVALAGEQVLPVADGLADLIPGQGLRRGSTVTLDGRGSGATSLALALLGRASAAGSWTAVVDMADLGLQAACELGVDLDRVVVVPSVRRATFGSTVAAVVDAFDLVLVRADWPVKAADVRRLTARARERGAVLVALGSGWGEGGDVHLRVAASVWDGLGRGHGHLRARRLTVEVAGRRASARPRRLEIDVRNGQMVVTAPIHPLPGISVHSHRRGWGSNAPRSQEL